MFAKAWTSFVVLLAVSLEVHAHAAIAPVLGKGSTAPARKDVTRPSKAAPCGAGVNVASALGQSTPVQAAADGTVTATITNFNGGKDGSRQVTAQVDAAATGKNFVAMTVSQNGDAAPASAGSQQLVASLPAGTKCTGGASGNLCLVSFTTLGGFGNCIAVQQGAGGAAAAAAGSTAAAGSSASNSTTTGTTGTAGSNSTATGTTGVAAGGAGATGAGTTAKGGHRQAHGGAAAAGAAAKKAKGQGHAQNGGAAGAAGNGKANGGAAGGAGNGKANGGAAGAAGAANANGGAAGAAGATGAAGGAANANGGAAGATGAAAGVQNGKATGLNGAIAQANERGRFAQGGSRAARALIAGLEERGEEIVHNVRRSIVGWIWA